jgi:hypothetical protein
MAALTEDQSDEVEALESIYPDEFELDLTSDSKLPKYRLKLVPDASAPEEENHVGATLICTIPSDYPSGDGLPAFEVEPFKGLGKKQCEEIIKIAEESALENQGMASIFTVAEAVREWLVDNNVAGQDGSMYADMMRRMNAKGAEEKKIAAKKAIAQAADAEDAEEVVDEEELERQRRRQAGTEVTVESFMEWKKAFDDEMRVMKGENGDDDERPTGKQLFQTNRAGMEDALIAEAEEEGATVEVIGDDTDPKLAIDSELYGDEDLDDLYLDELDFDDEEEDWEPDDEAEDD